MITIEGARAVLAEDSLGSIEEGKHADPTLYDTSGREWAPAMMSCARSSMRWTEEACEP